MLPDNKFPSDQPLGRGQLQAVWDAVSNDLKATMGESTYELWFSQSTLIKVGENRAVITAPGAMYAIWIEENFRDILKLHLDRYLVDLKSFSLDYGRFDADQPAAEEPVEKAPEDSISVAKKSQKRSKRPKRDLTPEEIHEKGLDAGLNEIYTFEKYVVGDNSKLAHAAAISAVENPGTLHQPLFFHSNSGLGKTHLLHAIGWDFLQRRPHSNVVYVTAESFANEYIEAIRNSKEVEYRKKYRNADLLLIDDIQFLSGKSGFQREFFHTFNSIADHRNQIVVASDCLASEIAQLEERIVSRLQWGMTVQVHPPDEATAEAILRKKREDLKVNISDEIISKIVDRVSCNVRQLEGALIRTGMVAGLNGGSIREEELDDLLADLINTDAGKPLGLEEIKENVSEFFGVEVRDIEGKRRMAKITEARQVAMYLCRDLTTHSLKEIASSFAKDHASVIYAVKSVKAKCDKSETLKNSVDLLRRRIAKGGNRSGSQLIESKPKSDSLRGFE